ncbi:MAG: DUF507 family protein [Bryobacterales bacterium]|nr:DUF507 family protein [Bryobacterales bacterium]
MLVAPEFIAYACRQIIRKIHPMWTECANLDSAAVQMARVIEEDLRAEDDLNEEVREILEQYESAMQQEGASYMEMFRRIKRKLVVERKLVLASGRESGDKMKLSRDKILDLSHKVVAELKRSRDVRIRKDPNDVRLQVVKHLTEIFQLEEKVDSSARDKVRTLKRGVVEGAEELKRFGIDLTK